jgi:hypothetical protein
MLNKKGNTEENRIKNKIVYVYNATHHHIDNHSECAKQGVFISNRQKRKNSSVCKESEKMVGRYQFTHFIGREHRSYF